MHLQLSMEFLLQHLEKLICFTSRVLQFREEWDQVLVSFHVYGSPKKQSGFFLSLFICQESVLLITYLVTLRLLRLCWF